MEENLKQLLLKDLCARLPYGVIVSYQVGENTPVNRVFTGKAFDELVRGSYVDEWLKCSFRPYLRPLSSMTEEERNEISKKLNYEFYVDDEGALCAEDDRHRVRVDLIEIYIEWLNAHHFDYRELIPIGLGIDCTGLNIYENEKSI